jgi:hypothetical protein
LYLHTFTLFWCPIRCSVLSFVSSHLHIVVMSYTMFSAVVCIFTPSHCCDVRYDVLFFLLYLHTFTLFCIGHHNSVKVWRYKRQNRTSYQTPQQCEGVKIQTTEQNIVSDITTVWRCEDTNDRTEHRISTPSRCCGVWYDVLFCRLYLRTFTLLWCLIRCSFLSFVSSHLHIVVMSDTMFCSVVCIFKNIASDITTVWRCEDTNDRKEHRIRHHNSVKVWRYKRQNRTSYRTSQQCEGMKIQTTEENIVSDITIVWRSDTMFCSVFCIFIPSHCCDVRYDVLFCRLYIFTPSHCCGVWYYVLFCRLYLHKRQNRTSYRTSQQCEGMKIQTTEENIVSDITIVWRCEDTNDRTEHRIRHHNSIQFRGTEDIKYSTVSLKRLNTVMHRWTC